MTKSLIVLFTLLLVLANPLSAAQKYQLSDLFHPVKWGDSPETVSATFKSPSFQTDAGLVVVSTRIGEHDATGMFRFQDGRLIANTVLVVRPKDKDPVEFCKEEFGKFLSFWGPPDHIEKIGPVYKDTNTVLQIVCNPTGFWLNYSSAAWVVKTSNIPDNSCNVKGRCFDL